jgi:flagellar motor switch/type III secretory pathway protein FliN
MTPAFRHWLPEDTAAPLVETAIAGIVARWSQGWFARQELRVTGSFARAEEAVARPLRQQEWHMLDDGLAIALSPRDTLALGMLVLGLDPAPEPLNPADTDLLRALAGDCLEDLKRRLVAWLGTTASAWRRSESADAQFSDGARTVAVVDAGQHGVFVLSVSADLFARRAKQALPAPPEGVPLGRGDKALAGLPVTIGAMVGGCTITVAELSGLAAGDVLLLDRALDAFHPLAIDGTAMSIGRCTIVHGDRAIALRIVEPLV